MEGNSFLDDEKFSFLWFACRFLKLFALYKIYLFEFRINESIRKPFVRIFHGLELRR